MTKLRAQIDWLLGHWQPYRRDVPLLLFLTFANAAVLVAYPYLLKRIVDAVSDSVSMSVLLTAVFLLLLVGGLRFCIYTVLQTLRTKLNMQLEFTVRVRAFEHLLQKGPAFFSRFRTGDVVTRLMDDVNDKLSWFMCSGIFRVVEAGAIVVFGLAMMISISPELTLYAAGPLPILVALFMITASKLHERYEAVQSSISQLNDSLESCFSGIRVVKSFAAEPVQKLRVEDAIDKQKQAEIRAVRWQTVIDSLYGNVWQLAVVGVLLAGGSMAMQEEITLGDVIAFDAYVLLLVWPMFDIGQFLVRGRLSAVSIDRIAELEMAPLELIEGTPTAVVSRRPGAPDVDDFPSPASGGASQTIEFQDVSYRYPGADRDAVSGLSFTAQPGSITAIVGAIGAGKSTVLALVPRLLDPTHGRITVNGRPLDQLDLVAHRQRLGYVPQDPILLSGTIEENIRFGRDWVTEEQFFRAVEVAQLEADLAMMPDGIQTVVGSRGVRLSGGQKQRVAVARALAGEPSLLLLDDCTASLDTKTEQRLWERLFHVFPDCTILLVSHRPATLARARQIVLLEQGCMAEKGSFSQVHQPGTLFYDLYTRWELAELTGDA